MKSRRQGEGFVYRVFVSPEGDDDPEFTEIQKQEWNDPLRPVRKDVDDWSKWLKERSLPDFGWGAVSHDLVFRPIMACGLEPEERAMTAYEYLKLRFSDEPFHTAVLASNAVELEFLASSPKEEWEAAGYDVRHKSETEFRLACAVALGKVIKELELRDEPSPEGGKNPKTGSGYRLEDDMDIGAHFHQKDTEPATRGRSQKSKKREEGVIALCRRALRKGKGRKKNGKINAAGLSRIYVDAGYREIGEEATRKIITKAIRDGELV